MPQEIIDYINTEKVGVLAVQMLDKAPHAAAIHFAHSTDPFVFYFETGKGTMKAQSVLKNGSTKASFVLSNVEVMKTLQLDGDVALTNDQLIKDIFFAKFPNKKTSYDPDKHILLIFKPTWWRFTDFKAEGGKRIISSE